MVGQNRACNPAACAPSAAPGAANAAAKQRIIGWTRDFIDIPTKVPGLIDRY
jgi:hypothetical protein